MYFKKAETNSSYFLSDAENVNQQQSNINRAYPEITYIILHSYAWSTSFVILAF